MKLLVFLTLLLGTASPAFGQASDAALRATIEKDRSSRTADGRLMTLTASEHLSRGAVYFDNRSFAAAREHFQKILDNYPSDPALSSALFMLGRSYYWERQYTKCIPILARVATEFPATKDGREGLYFQASCNVRLGKNAEAAPLFERYTVMYPDGERVEGAYLNAIDALRESGQYAAADNWVERTRSRFKATPAETNALHARLRMQVYRGLWADAVATSALMEAQANFRGSLTSLDEVKYLRAYALERQNKKNDAAAILRTINPASYYGGLAADRLLKGDLLAPTGLSTTTGSAPPPAAKDFPVPFRADVVRYANRHKLDPRFVMAIMKQESSFRPEVKSPSAARGLLQLVMDTALKYNKRAGFATLQPDDLYTPQINIAIGTEYLGDLRGQFNGLYEAMAASYNGGEDNAARWLNRSKPKDAAIFASEIGFSETKNYVFKVMNNFRAYKKLYDADLNKR